MTGLQKTVEILHGMMNQTCDFLTIKMESVDDFGGVPPTLDLQLMVRRYNLTMYLYFEKPMSSNMVIQRSSSMPENMLVSSLNQEMTRRMMNTSEQLDIDKRVGVVNDYAQKLINSGFGIDQSRTIIVGGLVSYERRVKISKDEKLPGWRPLHEGAGFRKAQRMKKKILSKSTWFKTGKRKETERVEDHDVEKNLSPKKKLKMGAVDARTGYSQERVGKNIQRRRKNYLLMRLRP